MATKSVHVAEVKLQTSGAAEVAKVFDNLKNLNPTKEMQLNIERVKGAVINLMAEAQKQMSTGVFDFSKLDLNKVSTAFAKLFDKFNKMAEQGKFGDKLVGTFDIEISKLQNDITTFTGKIRESEIAVEGLKEELSQLRKTDAIADRYKGPKALAERTAFVQGKVLDPKTKETDKKKYQTELDELKKYAIEYKRLNAAIESEGKKQNKIREDVVNKNEEINKKKEAQKTAPTDIKEIADLNNVYETLVNLLQKLNTQYNNKGQQKNIKDTKEAAKAVKDLEKEEKKHEKTLGGKILTGVSYYVIFNKVKQLYRDMVRTITELDKAMTTVAMVTSMNRKEAWELLGTYQALAKQVGITTSEVANLSVYFFRQGRNVKDAMVLTEIAAKSARVAGIAAEEAANYLTSAVNGFGLAAEQAEDVADKFSQIAANSASSFEELAIAMSKVAPVAQSAGISIDFMMGVLAKGIETTREAPENIGTAFKTVFARMREITDIGKAMEDGMSVNRVEKAVNSIGVALRTADGQFRNLEEVLMEVGEEWKNLSSIEQAYLATALAGTRQQPRLLAIFNDFERTKELIEISRDSTGAMSMQHIEYMEGMQAATANLKTAWEEFITTFASSEVIIGVFQGLADSISWLANGFSKLGTAGQLMIATFTALTAAIMISKVRIVAETAVTYKNAIAKMIQAASIKYLATQRMKNSALIGPGIALTYADAVASSTASVANMGLAATLKLVGAAFWASLGPIALVVAAVAAVIGVVSLLIRAHKEATKSLDDYNKQIQKNNKLMYENSQKTQSLEKLISEYDNLNKKLVKTQEELQRIKQLQNELAEFDTGEDKNSFTQELGGSTIVNTAAIDEYQSTLNQQNEDMLAENMGSVRAALVKKMDITSSPEMMAAMHDLGYGMVEQTIDGIEDANVKKKINDAFVQGLTDIDYSDYISTSMSDSGSDAQAQELMVIDYWKDLEGNLYETKEEAKRMIDNQRKEMTKWKKFWRRNYATQATLAESTEYNELNTDMLEQSHAFRLELLKDFYTRQAQNEIENAENSRGLLENNLKNYNDQLDAINKDPRFTEDIKKDMIASLEYNMRDEASLKMLLEEKRIPIELIVTAVDLGVSLGELANLTGELEDKIKASMPVLNLSNLTGQTGSLGFRSQAELQAFLERANASAISVEDTVTNAISGMHSILDSTSGNIGANISAFRALLTKDARMTAEQAEAFIDQLIDKRTDTAVKIMSDILDTQKMGDGFTKMFEEMAKGDFSGFQQLAEEFTLDSVQGFITGEKTINEIMEERVKLYKEELQLRINALKIKSELSPIEATELAQLELMINNYDLLNISAISRKNSLDSTLAIIDKMNNSLALQNSLIEMGFTKDSTIYNFFKEFGDMTKEMASAGMESTIDQYVGDLAALKAEMFNQGMLDGEFNLINLDNMTAQQATLFASYQSMIDEFAGATDEYLEYITKAYADQKKEIEEMYTNEINLLKEANTERWKEIEYANSLLDLQDKIATSREKLLGMTLEGSSSGNIEQARKDLQALQRERQKMVEARMIEEAEKQLQAERDTRLAALQQTQIDEMVNLTNGLTTLNSTIRNLINSKNGQAQIVPSWLGGGPNFDFTD